MLQVEVGVVIIQQIQEQEEQRKFNILIIILYIQDITVLQEDPHGMVEGGVDIQALVLMRLLLMVEMEELE